MDTKQKELSSSCRCRLCEPPTEPTKYDNSEQKLLMDVHGHGWGVIGIRAELGSPGWAFTVGLWHTFRSPEIAMFGLQVEDCSAGSIWPAIKSKAGPPATAGVSRGDNRRLPGYVAASASHVVRGSLRLGSLVLAASAIADCPADLARPARTISMAGRFR